MTAFRLPVRVYYEDTDHGGVVYHANYLKFMERARTEWLRMAGIDQDRLCTEQGVVFVITHADIHFRQPARFNDLLAVSVTLKQTKQASIGFEQSICRHDDATVLCNGYIRAACVDSRSFKPQVIPADVLARIVEYQR